MRKLIYFLIRHSSWLLYTLYAVVSLLLLVKYNPYQQSVYLSSANRLAGSIYAVKGNVTGYFGLQEINRDLQEQNGVLEVKLAALRDYIARLEGDSLLLRRPADSIYADYRFVVAQVINNSVAASHNYITLNKGLRDGIHSEMGVVDQNGIVGIVNAVSDNYAVVISLLNPKLRLSCKVKGSSYFGSLVWDGKDARYALLEEMPRHVAFAKGDTIVTSGYSAVFPEGVMVGIISDFSKQRNDNFYALKVELSTDFYRLNDVRVIESKGQQEKTRLEKEAMLNE
ncbi:MAG: rod shape-determining protein MreC [Coprobacter sp.]|nr:rod shape-determining protein MreC [Coprobacter sp.]